MSLGEKSVITFFPSKLLLAHDFAGDGRSWIKGGTVL